MTSTNLKPGIDPLTQQAPQISTQCDPPVAAFGAITDASFEATTTTTTITEQNDNSLEAINAMALALTTDEDSTIQVATEVAQRAAEAVTAMHNATILIPPPLPPLSPNVARRLYDEVDIESEPQQTVPIIEVADKKWYNMPQESERPMNGPIPFKEWGLKIPTGEMWRDNCNLDSSISQLDVFLQMFPAEALNIMHRETNKCINKQENNNQTTTTKQELLKFIGIIILTTKYEWNDRADLWSNQKPSKYEMAPNFGDMTGMKRNRFDAIWKCMRYSHQPDEMPDGMNSETYRWMLIQDFVNAINNHRAAYVMVSDRICVDESFSRWYGHGGTWINIGVPNYVSYDRKPDDGCELWTCCDGRNGIMIGIKIVKSQSELESERVDLDQGELNHGTQVLLELISPWFHSNRLVCADSYFSSVQTAIKCKERGMKYIDVVKTATKGFPISYLGKLELKDKGD